MATPASTAEALEMVRDGLSYLAAADPTVLAAQAQAECLQTLEQADAIATAARARVLAAFTAGQGYAADADYSPTSWLIHRTKVTKGAARGHLGWARRAAAHPQVLAALAEGTVLSESMARLICGWTDRLPAGCRDAADGILLTAARAGARMEDLAGLAAEIYARSLPDSQEDNDLDPADQAEGPTGQAGRPEDSPGEPRPAAGPSGDPPAPGPQPPTAQAQEMLRHAIIGRAVDLVSGPGGLASFLRTRLLGARLAGPSLPLDVGHSAEIPAAIRRAVILRDQHCRWAGGYFH